jgi:hypothetical protein
MEAFAQQKNLAALKQQQQQLKQPVQQRRPQAGIDAGRSHYTPTVRPALPGRSRRMRKRSVKVLKTDALSPDHCVGFRLPMSMQEFERSGFSRCCGVGSGGGGGVYR